MTSTGQHLPPSNSASTAPLSASVGHYENFPVASWLCPPALRPAVVALYHFARTADDLADEGDRSAGERLAQLGAYRLALERCLSGQPDASDWPQVFGPLAQAVQRHALPGPLLHNLISAFEQDVRHTAAGYLYADTTELLAYCQLSANPVGRLLLHLYGISDDTSRAQSDAVCSALQLINFWQDFSLDLPRARVYLPEQDARRHGVDLTNPSSLNDSPATQALVSELCEWARHLMRQGADLALDLPGRAGWELRLVVQGGLRVLDKIAALEFRTLRRRPTLGLADMWPTSWRALTMRRNASLPS